MKKIIVLGGGYGGIKALQTFAKENTENINITLIDQHSFHYLQTESYDLVASKIPIEETFIYLPTLVKGIDKKFNFICDKALKIENNTLICENGTYSFDYLIIAVGSVTRFLKGFEKKDHHSFGVKSLRGALNIKQFFEKELYDRLEITKAKKSFNIIVIGGGLSGVEIASEMQNYFNNYSKNNALTCGKISIKLISKHVLKNMPKSTQKLTLKRLKNLGVDIISAHVKEVKENSAYLDNNQTVDYDFAIFTGGIEPAPFIKNLDFKKDKRGFLIVDDYLRVNEKIFAIGDCALLLDKNKKPIPPTAQSAEQSGVIAAKNIINFINKKDLIKADIKLLGLAIALGGKYGIIVTPFNINITSFFGWFIKKAIEKYYKIPLKFKAKKGYQILKLCKKEVL